MLAGEKTPICSGFFLSEADIPTDILRSRDVLKWPRYYNKIVEIVGATTELAGQRGPGPVLGAEGQTRCSICLPYNAAP